MHPLKPGEDSNIRPWFESVSLAKQRDLSILAVNIILLKRAGAGSRHCTPVARTGSCLLIEKRRIRRFSRSISAGW